MTLFWISTLVVTLAALVLVALPLFRNKENNDEALRDELNKALYKDRLSELEVETSEGLVENQDELISDLKQSLLDDIPADQTVTQQSRSSSIAVMVGSTVLVVALSYGMYSYFGSYQKVAKWQEVSGNLPALSKKLMSPEGGAMSEEEMQDLTLALRTRLHYNPEDSTGWLLLGRIAMSNRTVDIAIDAMKKAYKFEPNNEDIQLAYAQAMMLSQNDAEQNDARSLLMHLAKQEYVDLRVFSLLAFDAFERSDFAGAVKYWSIMQHMIGPEDSRYQMLKRSIMSAKQKLDVPTPTAASIAVTLKLGSNVVLPEQGVVIVSVHTADGAPMPVAAARYPIGQFPKTVVLDDSSSMIQGRNLSDLESLIVRARIDSDGNVATKTGDWHGTSRAAALGESVDIVIDQQY